MKRYIYKLKKGIFTGVGIALGTGIGTIALYAVSVTLNTFMAGTPINAAKMNENFTNLKTAVDAAVPAGTVFAYTGTTAPDGFLICNGNAYPKSSYPALAALLETATGSRFGAPDISTFRVPDLRGRFLRGVNDASGNDPDASGRYALYTGGSDQDNIGSYQDDMLKSHTHSYISNGGTDNDQDGSGPGNGMGWPSSFQTGSSPTLGGNETRPKNVYVNFIIKY